MEFCSSDRNALMNSTQFKMMKSLRQTIKTIVSEKSGIDHVRRDHHLEGTFKLICDSKTMPDIFFPGTSVEVLKGLPKDLRDVLQWKDISLDIQKIAKNAAEVLDNIKIKGAQRGDFMDEATEAVLLPQIAQEALAKGLIEAVRALSRRVSSINAKVSFHFADSEAEEAKMDQLDEDTVNIFLRQAIAVQNEYLGEEWSDVIRNDIKRYIRDEKLSAVGADGGPTVRKVDSSSESTKFYSEKGGADSVCSKMCWLEMSSTLTEKYPAISEAVKMLHSLPFELNAKCSSGSKTKLLEPSKGCTMLVWYPVGSQHLSRLDSRDDGSDLDSGIRITCAYHLRADASAQRMRTESLGSPVETGGVDVGKQGTISGPTQTLGQNSGEGGNQSRGFTRMLYTEANIGALDATSSAGTATPFNHEVVVKDDMLTIHRSTCLRNARSPAEEEYYVILFFIQGKEIDITS